MGGRRGRARWLPCLVGDLAPVERLDRQGRHDLGRPRGVPVREVVDAPRDPVLVGPALLRLVVDPGWQRALQDAGQPGVPVGAARQALALQALGRREDDGGR
jgi:hypothetical protein